MVYYNHELIGLSAVKQSADTNPLTYVFCQGLNIQTFIRAVSTHVSPVMIHWCSHLSPQLLSVLREIG